MLHQGKEIRKSNSVPENRAEKNEEADSGTEIFVKSAARTVAIGAAAIAGIALVAIFSAPVALTLGIGLGVKALADSFLSHANEALDQQEIFDFMIRYLGLSVAYQLTSAQQYIGYRV